MTPSRWRGSRRATHASSGRPSFVPGGPTIRAEPSSTPPLDVMRNQLDCTCQVPTCSDGARNGVHQKELSLERFHGARGYQRSPCRETPPLHHPSLFIDKGEPRRGRRGSKNRIMVLWSRVARMTDFGDREKKRVVNRSSTVDRRPHSTRRVRPQSSARDRASSCGGPSFGLGMREWA